jgi:hypothetical protein
MCDPQARPGIFHVVARLMEMQKELASSQPSSPPTGPTTEEALTMVRRVASEPRMATSSEGLAVSMTEAAPQGVEPGIADVDKPGKRTVIPGGR